VPHLSGKVAYLSADALPKGSIGAASYRAEIHLNPREADRIGAGALLPGMPVSVFIQTAARSPLAYLVQPFTAYFARALRET
jgi:HlyD family secretion protein